MPHVSQDNRFRPADLHRRKFTPAMLAVPLIFLLLGEVPAMAAAPNSGAAEISANRQAAGIQDELRLAGDYMVGRGVEKDPVQAAYWYKKAANQGDPAAQNELGYLYVWGIGVEPNPAEAAKWFMRASGGGSQGAKLNLAVLSLRGLGVKKDLRLAFDLLTQLAEKKNARAADYLGAMYFSGYGVEQNRATAEKWFRLAARGHNPEGEFAMGSLYSDWPGHQRDYRKAAKFLRESAKAGFVPAMSALGILLENHREVPRKGADEPIRLLTRSAEAGTWESSASLGMLARAGHERNRDFAEAYRWFTIALHQGGTDAAGSTQRDLLRCRQVLSREQQSREEEAANAWLAQHPHSDLFIFETPTRALFPTAEILATGQQSGE